MNTPVEFEYSVEIEIPSHALNKSESPSEFFVGSCDLYATLTYSAISEDILVVLTINYRNPEFGMHHQPSIYYS